MKRGVAFRVLDVRGLHGQQHTATEVGRCGSPSSDYQTMAQVQLVLLLLLLLIRCATFGIGSSLHDDLSADWCLMLQHLTGTCRSTTSAVVSTHRTGF